MRLNHDCVRETMLYLERTLEYTGAINLSDFTLEGFTYEDTIYTLQKLSEAEYISATVKQDVTGDILIYVHSITWEGHRFLDTVRDNKVWTGTKKILSTVSSSSISFVSTIASQVLTNLISQQMGLNLPS